MATSMQVPLVGCASHRLDLTVQVILKKYDVILDNKQKLMLKLKYGILAAK